jgi:hypothetical protein
MHKQELENLEKRLRKYRSTVPDFLLMEERRRKVDLLLSYIMVFLVVVLLISIVMLIHFVQKGI